MEGLLPECWQHVMRFLGPCSLLTCAMVCHKWCEWAHEERYWSRHLDRVKEKLDVGHLFAGPIWKFYRNTFLSSPTTEIWTTVRSLYAVPAEGTWNVDISFFPDNMRYRVLILFQLPNSIHWYKDKLTVNEADGKHGTLDCRSLPLGVTCMFDRNVQPKLCRRYHSIVRDTDCSGPRDERVWLTISI